LNFVETNSAVPIVILQGGAETGVKEKEVLEKRDDE